MTETIEDLNFKITQVENKLDSLILEHVGLLLTLEVFVKERGLDNPISVGFQGPERLSVLLDRMWHSTFKILRPEGVRNGS